MWGEGRKPLWVCSPDPRPHTFAPSGPRTYRLDPSLPRCSRAWGKAACGTQEGVLFTPPSIPFSPHRARTQHLQSRKPPETDWGRDVFRGDDRGWSPCPPCVLSPRAAEIRAGREA